MLPAPRVESQRSRRPSPRRAMRRSRAHRATADEQHQERLEGRPRHGVEPAEAHPEGGGEKEVRVRESEHRRHGPENGDDPLRSRHRVRRLERELGIRNEQRGGEGDDDQRGEPERRPAHELPRPLLQPGGDPGAQRAGRDLQRQAEGDEARRRRRAVEEPLADGPQAGGDEAREEVGVELRHRAVGVVQQDEEDGRAEAEAPPEDERIPSGRGVARTVRARPGRGGRPPPAR